MANQDLSAHHKGRIRVPANDNGSIEKTPAHASEDMEQIDSLPTEKSAGLRVHCDLPDQLPILPQEIALIGPYVLDLIAGTHANDN